MRRLAAEELTPLETEEARDRHASWFAEAAERAYARPFPYDLDPKAYADDRRRWQADGGTSGSP